MDLEESEQGDGLGSIALFFYPTSKIMSRECQVDCPRLVLIGLGGLDDA